MTALGRAALRELAVRHGVRPNKALGQHFLTDPNLARAIAAEAGGRRVVEVGAGLGSLTLALAEAHAGVLAIEFDRALTPALREAVGAAPNVRVLEANALHLDWASTLGSGRWTMCSSLPYNIATPVVLGMLERAPGVERLVVVVQREAGERFVAGPGEEGYGPVSLRVAYRADAAVIRRVPPRVFWPEPKVESVVVRLERRKTPRVKTDPERLWAVVEAGFAARRKTIRSALRRLGAVEPDAVLASCGLEPAARAEDLPLEAFARIAEALG